MRDVATSHDRLLALQLAARVAPRPRVERHGAGHRHDRLDPAGDRRMGGARALRGADGQHRVLLGSQTGDEIVALDAAQRRDERCGVLRQADGLGVGNELASRGYQVARSMAKAHAELRQQRDAEIDRKQDGRDEQERDLAITPGLDDVGAVQQQHGSHEHVGGGDHARVAIADMHQLVRENSRQLIVIQTIDEPARDDDDEGRPRRAAREGVHRGRLYDADADRGHAGGDRQRLRQAAEPGVARLVDEPKRHVLAHRLHGPPHLGHEIGDSRERDDRHVTRPVSGPGVPGRMRRIEEDQRHEQHDHRHRLGQQSEAEQEGGGARIVARDPSVQAVDAHLRPRPRRPARRSGS